MAIPNLKRIKVSSEQELRNWLAKQSDQEQNLMLVTYNEASRDKYVSREQVRDALIEHGWAAGTRYTLNGNLLGHVISKQLNKHAATSR